MELLHIKDIGNVMAFDDFKELYTGSSCIEVCDTNTLPSKLFSKIKNNITVIVTGDYLIAEAFLRYMHHYEDELVGSEDYDYYKSKGMDLNYTAIKKIKLHRLNYLFKNSEAPFLDGAKTEETLKDWLPEDVKDNSFLLPARRYARILTDINRAKDGIYFDFIDATIYIAPNVYVPFDKSVPKMFLQFAKYIEDANVIDIGAGTGILSILAAQLGAKSVTAIDINPNAVDCVKKNIMHNNLEKTVSRVIRSNLFNNVEGTFDTIIFNAPWVKGSPKNIYETAIYDPDYKVITKFFEQAKKHLAKNGTILLQYSDISQANGDGSIDNLNAILKTNNLKIIDHSSILRRNRLIGAMERVYVFAIKTN